MNMESDDVRGGYDCKHYGMSGLEVCLTCQEPIKTDRKCFHCKRKLTVRECKRWAETGLKVTYIHCDVHVEEAFAKSREDVRAASAK